MNRVTRRETCRKLVYEFIKTNGPIDSSTIRYEVGKHYKNGIQANEMGRYLAELHGKGLIEIIGQRGSKHDNVWAVKE